MSKSLPILAVIAVVCLLVGGCGLSGYNNVIGLDEDVTASWAQVETQLQRRFDLIPNLVETVKGTAAQEKEVFIGVAEARNAYAKAGSTNEKVAAASMLERALGRLIAVREAYPELKSNASFMALMDQLEGTENRLTVARGRYNESVQQLNGTVRRFPGSIWASLAGVDQREYFEVDRAEVREAPKVDF